MKDSGHQENDGQADTKPSVRPTIYRLIFACTQTHMWKVADGVPIAQCLPQVGNAVVNNAEMGVPKLHLAKDDSVKVRALESYTATNGWLDQMRTGGQPCIML